ncbi:MAG TPA: hypothetical protein VF003_03185 [Pseudonocardiaceae bacterium]
MADDLLELALAATGGQELWKTLGGLRLDISIGGPIWAMKGWSPDTTFDQILMVDTINEHIVFSPFTRADRRMVFDAATDSVTMETLDGQPVETLAPAHAAFKGMLRDSAWDARHLGYFLGYACWNYFTTPFLFTYPDVRVREIQLWHEAGRTWRCLHVCFPPQIATHNPGQVFYFDALGMQRRMDYIVEVNGSTLVGHYTSGYQSFDGLLVAMRRRVFRRNPDNTVNLNLPSITLDIHDVELIRRDDRQAPP